MKRRAVTSILIILCMLTSLLSCVASAASGTGASQDDPYVVYTYDELRNAMDYRGDAAGKRFIRLGGDIDTSGENSGFGLRADQAIELRDTATLDLNGHKLIFHSEADDSQYVFLLSGAELTIEDSSETGNGEIFYNTTKKGPNHSVVRVDSGTLTINDGATLRAMMNVHSMMINAAVWVVGGNLIVNDGKLFAEYIYGDPGKTYDQYHSLTGISIEGKGKVTVNDGEFTGIDAYSKIRADGDTDPDIVINGGVFRQAMGVYAGSTLDKAGPKTLPIRINGGEFHHSQSKFGYEYQFNILVKNPVFSSGKTKFLNFDNEVGTDAWRTEVKNFMQELYSNLFPEDTVLLVDETAYQNTTIGAGAKLSNLITMPAAMSDEVNAWFTYADSEGETCEPKTIKVHSGLLDVKAEYDGENVPINVSDPRFFVDPNKGGNTVKFTWNALPDSIAAEGFTLTMHRLEGTVESELSSFDNGDGTCSTEIPLPPIESGKDYADGGVNADIYAVLALMKDGEMAAGTAAILYLKQKYTARLAGAILMLSGPLLAGSTTGPEITLQDGEKRIGIESQTPWVIEDDWEGSIPVSHENPIPVNAYCSVSVTLRAAGGYEFVSKLEGEPTRASVYLKGSETPLDVVAVLGVREDKKTAKVSFRLKATAKYENLSLTIPAPAHGIKPPDRYDVDGIPAGFLIEYGLLWEKKESDGGYSELYRNETFRQGNTYRCGIRLTVQSETEIQPGAIITVNGKKASWERQEYGSDDTIFIVQEFYIPDPRTAIDEVVLMVNDEEARYTADTELLTGVAVGGRYKKTFSKWYNSENQAMTGTLAPGESYTYKAIYRPEEGYRFETSGFSVRIYGEGALPESRVDVQADSLSVTYYFTVPAGAITDVTVNAIGIDASKYSVSGQTVTVTHDKACKAGYLDGEVYKAAAATKISDGKYSFTVPDGVEEVILVIKGDVNGDGKANSADTTLIKRSLLTASHPAYKAMTKTEAFAADVNGDGKVNSADSTLVKRSLLTVSHPAYKALEF